MTSEPDTIWPMRIARLSYDGEVETDSIIEGLNEARVLEITRLEDGRFKLTERCDEWFSVALTADQMRLLAQELIAMVDSDTQAVKPPS